MKSTNLKNLLKSNINLLNNKNYVKYASTWAITSGEGRKTRLGVQSTLLNAVKNHLVYYFMFEV